MLRAASEASRAQLELWVFDARTPPKSLTDLDASSAVAMLTPCEDTSVKRMQDAGCGWCDVGYRMGAEHGACGVDAA